MKEKKEKIEKKEIKKEAVDSKPEETIKDLEKRLVELKKQREELKPKEEKSEDRPDVIVEPPCEPKIVFDEKTGVVEAVYDSSCSIKQVQQIAGKIAIEGIRFRPEKAEQPEDISKETFFLKSDREKREKEIKKEFDEKVLACESGTDKSKTCESTESES